MRSVTSSRFIGFISAVMSGSRFKLSSYLTLKTGARQRTPAVPSMDGLRYGLSCW
jgi:hypothetical protein